MRGHLRKRGANSWEITLDYPRGEDDKRNQRTVTIHGTKTDAEKERTRLLRELDQGTAIDPNQLTVGEYLNRWLADYASTNVGPATYRRYAGIVKSRLIPAIGHHKLSNLRPLHIQDYYTKVLKEPPPGLKRPLSPTTVVQYHRILREALKHAVRWQLLAVNPADAVKPPRKDEKEMQVLTNQQAATLLEASKPYRLHVPIALALLCGLRSGEAFALRWGDIDLDAGVLHVRRSLEVLDGTPRFKDPKTARGRRTIALPGLMVEILREHQDKQKHEKETLGEGYHDGDLVCCRADGLPVIYNIHKRFAKILDDAKLPKVRFHDLRHGHATALMGLGVNPKVVSERLGHSGIAITLQTYSHVLPEMQREAADKLDGVFGRPAPGATEGNVGKMLASEEPAGEAARAPHYM